MSQFSRRQFLASTVGAAAASALTGCGGGSSSAAPTGVVTPATVDPANRYAQTNLMASQPGYGAKFVFNDAVDAWGLSIRPAGAGGHFWLSAGGTSYEFVGDVTASTDPTLRSLYIDPLAQVVLPSADARSDAASIGKATGNAFNGAPLDSNNFRITGQTVESAGQTVEFDGSARFVFVTDSGSLSGWTERRKDNGQIFRISGTAVERYNGASQGMQFFGVAIRTGTWDLAWVADFGQSPQLRTFDANWQLIDTVGFVNPFATGATGQARPGDPVPFNVVMLGNRVFVAYCKSQALKNDAGAVLDPNQFFAGEEDSLSAEDELRSGNRPDRGKLVEYDASGNLVRVYLDDGRLNAPWGVAIAPTNFGKLSGAVLVGNFGGAGRIVAYDGNTGAFIDYLRNDSGQIAGITGLWAILFGNGASLGDSNALYFAAGPRDETAGLFGALRVAA